MSRPRTVVIVGARLAGAKAAHTLFVHDDVFEERRVDLRHGETVLLRAAARDA